MPQYTKFVFDEIRRIGEAWADKNPDSIPQGLDRNQLLQLFEKIGDMSWRRIAIGDNPTGKSMKQIFEEIGVNPADYGEVDSAPIPIPPTDRSKLINHPRYGMSIAAIITNNKHNIPETVKRFEDAGVNSTRINLLAALWKEEAYKPTTLPYTQLADGRWDLFKWNTEYFDRLAETKERMNSAGINIQWTNYGLYDWSSRKKGSQQEGTPVRNNVNGIFWKEDDSTLLILPNDGWSIPWFGKVCPLLDLDINPFEIGNEFPESELHARVRDEVRKIVPNALIQVNRNTDMPGQYANMMKEKNHYNFIAFHGNKLKQISDLDEKYKDEPVYKTFNQFITDCPHDSKKVIFSSDGARRKDNNNSPIDTYDWDKLGKFFDHVKGLGYGIEHQSRAKMTPPPNHHMIEVDWFIERVR